MAILSDLRYAVRLLVRSPVFSLTAILSLAIGIGASTTIYSLADALLFSPSAGVRAASEVVDIGRSNEGSGFDNMSHPAYVYLQEHTTTLQAMSAVEFGGNPMSLAENGASERITGVLVSGSFFDVLGTRPALGRFFRTDEDAVVGERPVAVISHAFWQQRFNGDKEILQKPVRLNNQLFSIVGRNISQEIRAAMVQVDAGVPIILMQSFADATAIGLIPQKLAAWTAGSVGVIGIFLAALGLYGLMAFLVTQRTREIAIRMALGASAGNMRSMVMKQAAWLGTTGGVIGLMLAGVIGTLAQSLLVGVPAIDPIAFGGTAILFAVVLALVCWLPARRAAATDPATALRAE